jgi:hypothetical protein
MLRVAPGHLADAMLTNQLRYLRAGFNTAMIYSSLDRDFFIRVLLSENSTPQLS